MIDTHCHIHSADYPLDAVEEFMEATAAGVSAVICIGTDLVSSLDAIAFAHQHDGVYASVGLHPSDNDDIAEVAKLSTLIDEKVIAVGECGLDYYYDRYPRDVQLAIFKAQAELAKEHELPIIMHVRAKPQEEQQVFADVWQVVDRLELRGVVHSFSGTEEIRKQITDRGFYLGINGIATFMTHQQMETLRNAPLESIVLETDAPLLTPVPMRGKPNTPAYLPHIAQHIAELKNIDFQMVDDQTTANAKRLFAI